MSKQEKKRKTPMDIKKKHITYTLPGKFTT